MLFLIQGTMKRGAGCTERSQKKRKKKGKSTPKSRKASGTRRGKGLMNICPGSLQEHKRSSQCRSDGCSKNNLLATRDAQDGGYSFLASPHRLHMLVLIVRDVSEHFVKVVGGWTSAPSGPLRLPKACDHGNQSVGIITIIF